MQSSAKSPGNIPEAWSAGAGILLLCAVEWGWFASLSARFTSGAARTGASVWLVLALAWLGLNIVLSRRHVPEAYTRWFPTIVQALALVGLSVALALCWSPLSAALRSVAQQVTVVELIGFHGLRLAAWGTVRKWRQGQLPTYFLLAGSVPDLLFAVQAVAVAALLAAGVITMSGTLLIIWSVLGFVAFLGAAVTMNFGVPGSSISIRWSHVRAGRESDTYLPFRWPMNLAPAFTTSLFTLAHVLAITKSLVS